MGGLEGSARHMLLTGAVTEGRGWEDLARLTCAVAEA